MTVQTHQFDVIVVGAGGAGLMAALYASRGAKTAVVFDGVGPQLPVQVHALAVAFGNVESPLVWRNQDTVGHGGVKGLPGGGVTARPTR